MKQSVERQYAICRGIVADIIREGIDDGDIRDSSPADLASLLQGMIDAMLGQWLVDDGLASLAEKAEWLADFFARAAAPDPERAE